MAFHLHDEPGALPRLPLSPAALALNTVDRRYLRWNARRSLATSGFFAGERFDIADFDIDFFYAGPFGARAEEPAP